MAQGAATSLEDGAFLGTVFGRVVKGELTVSEALDLYEKARMPKADYKQQVSFVNGAIWHLPDGPQQEVTPLPFTSP
jgi:salicylate hydroxylase